MNNSAKILNWVSTKIQTIDKNLLNFWDITPQKPEKIWSVLNNTLQEWNKVKKIFTSLQVNQKLLVLLHHSSNNWKRKIMKLFTWLTQLINTFFNNSKILKDINSETPPKKDSNSTKVKMKRKNYKNKKLHLKDFVNYANKFLLIKLKKFKYLKDLMNHHVL